MASCRTSEVHPAFDQSFDPGVSTSPPKSLTWVSSPSPTRGRFMSASIAAFASGETALPRAIQSASAATASLVTRFRFSRFAPSSSRSRP